MWRSLAGRLLLQAWRGRAEAAGANAVGASLPAAAACARQELPQQQRQQLFAWLQSAGVRSGTWHTPRHAHPHPRRRALRRAAVATSKATALAVVGLPAAAAAALVLKGRGDADAGELLRSLPRTARVVWWGLWASYKVGPAACYAQRAHQAAARRDGAGLPGVQQAPALCARLLACRPAYTLPPLLRAVRPRAVPVGCGPSSPAQPCSAGKPAPGSPLQYKALALRYDGVDPSTPAYQHALAELHEHAASRLLLACQANGGLYIKAGQLAVALHAVPVQYRRLAPCLERTGTGARVFVW